MSRPMNEEKRLSDTRADASGGGGGRKARLRGYRGYLKPAWAWGAPSPARWAMGAPPGVRPHGRVPGSAGFGPRRPQPLAHAVRGASPHPVGHPFDQGVFQALLPNRTYGAHPAGGGDPRPVGREEVDVRAAPARSLPHPVGVGMGPLAGGDEAPGAGRSSALCSHTVGDA